MIRIILLFFIWAFAIPAHSNPYENVWYRWNTFQDTSSDENMYLRCGVFELRDYVHVASQDFKIVKFKKKQYDLYELIDDKWKKLDASFSDRRIIFKGNANIYPSNIIDEKSIFSLNETYSILLDLSSRRFKSIEDKYINENVDRKKQNKYFRDDFEILNKVKIDYNINLSAGVINYNKKTYDKNDPNLNQVLKYKDLITSQVLELEYSPNTALEIPKAFEFDCRALKR